MISINYAVFSVMNFCINNFIENYVSVMNLWLNRFIKNYVFDFT